LPSLSLRPGVERRMKLALAPSLKLPVERRAAEDFFA
jgi:hypothetical protein